MCTFLRKKRNNRQNCQNTGLSIVNWFLRFLSKSRFLTQKRKCARFYGKKRKNRHIWENTIQQETFMTFLERPLKESRQGSPNPKFEKCWQKSPILIKNMGHTLDFYVKIVKTRDYPSWIDFLRFLSKSRFLTQKRKCARFYEKIATVVKMGKIR